jgi:hypothetical protein
MRLTGVLGNTVLEEFQGLLIQPEILVTESKVGRDVGTLYAAS